MPVIVSTGDVTPGPFRPRHGMSVVEADQSPIVGIVHSQRVFNTVRTLGTGCHPPYCKLHPISSAFIDDVDVSIQIEQVLERMVLLRSMPFHSSNVISK